MDLEYAIEKYYPKALTFVALRARSKKEVVDRLNRYFQKSDLTSDLKDASIDAILLRLEEDRLVDDKKFASDFVYSIFNSSRPRGKQYVLRYLMKKGVPRPIIEVALQKVAPEDELASAKAAAEKKIRITRAKNIHDLKKKLWAHLVGKGFSSDVIGHVIDTTLGVK